MHIFLIKIDDVLEAEIYSRYIHRSKLIFLRNSYLIAYVYDELSGS